MEVYLTVGNLGILVLAQGLSRTGTEGCAGMLVQMNIDDDKEVLAEYMQHFRSGKQLLKITEKMKEKYSRDEGENNKKVGDDEALQSRQDATVGMMDLDSGL